MFKNILPSRRNPSFDLVDPEPVPEPAQIGKENRPQHPLANMVTSPTELKPPAIQAAKRPGSPQVSVRHQGPGRLAEAGATNRAFERMLDDMQIPSTLRPKLITLDSPVKAAMLKSSQNLSLLNPAFPVPKAPRRTRSIETLSSSRPFSHVPSPSLDGTVNYNDILTPPRPISAMYGSGSSYNSSSGSLASALNSGSVEFLPVSSALPNAENGGTESSPKKNAKLKANKDKTAKVAPLEKDKLSAEAMSVWLASTKSTAMDIERLKRLRLLLRNEAASWSETFLIGGGYSALLARLNELLEVEWREEQHDDQALHELLRCFKALSTSSIGCFALRSACPTPFPQLVRLLYSDKKPGDIASRQLIVDLLLILYELYPSAKKPADPTGSPGRRNAWEFKDSGHVIPPARPTVFTVADAPPPPLPAPHTSSYSLLRGILLTPRPAPSECPSIPVDPHAFIASLHKPRIYKTYLQEMADIRRDYFWVFCHPTNAIWDLAQTDEESVEKPKAPGGMTGGVEFEAMTYLTTHFRLVNTLCRAAAELGLPSNEEQSAYKFHSDLFESGFEKIVLTSRKASTQYYPSLHLEISRYVAHAIRAQYQLPYTISRLVGLPPSPLIRRASPNPSRPKMMSTSSIPLPARGGMPAGRTPVLPPRQRMEELHFKD